MIFKLITKLLIFLANYVNHAKPLEEWAHFRLEKVCCKYLILEQNIMNKNKFMGNRKLVLLTANPSFVDCKFQFHSKVILTSTGFEMNFVSLYQGMTMHISENKGGHIKLSFCQWTKWEHPIPFPF